MANHKAKITTAGVGKIAADKRKAAQLSNIKKRVAAAWTIASTMLPDAPANIRTHLAKSLMANNTGVLKAALRQVAVNSHFTHVAEQLSKVHKIDINDLLEDPSVLTKEDNAVKSELKGDAKNASKKKADDTEAAGLLPEKYPEPKRDEPKDLDAEHAADRPEQTMEKESSKKKACGKDCKGCPECDKDKKDKKEAGKKKACGKDCKGCPECEKDMKKEDKKDKKEAGKKKAEEEPIAEADEAEVDAEDAEADAEDADVDAEEAEDDADVAEDEADDVDLDEEMADDEDTEEGDVEAEPFDKEMADLEDLAEDLQHDVEALQDAVEDIADDSEESPLDGVDEEAFADDEDGEASFDDFFSDGEGDTEEVEGDMPEGEELDMDSIFDEGAMTDKVSALNDEGGDEIEMIEGDEDYFGPSDAADLEDQLDLEEGMFDPSSMFDAEVGDPLEALLKHASEKDFDIVDPSDIESEHGDDDRDSDTDHDDSPLYEALRAIKQFDYPDTDRDTQPNLKSAKKVAKRQPVVRSIRQRGSVKKASATDMINLIFGDSDSDY